MVNESGKAYTKGNKADRSVMARTSNIFLYTGLLVMISSLIFMISNVNKADSIVFSWLPVIIVGAVLTIVSQLIK